MSFLSRVALGLACWSAWAATARTADFYGWQGLRVAAQEGEPERMSAADLDGDGRQELVVVNTRHSRLDLYRWNTKDERKPPSARDPDRPNELPLAPDWSHYEVPLEDLPADALPVDVEGDHRPELLVLTGPALKLVVYQSDAIGKWKRLRHWDLQAGQLVGKGPLLLLRTIGAAAPQRPQQTTDARKNSVAPAPRREVLVSCEQGIQVVPLDKDSRASWFHPRETVSRADWRLTDLDGDGDQDLLEWTTKANQTVRWYECVEGALRPAQPLYDQTVQQVASMTSRDGPTEVLCLGGAQSGIARRYRLARGDESPWGRQATLPLAYGPSAPWCGVRLGDAVALAAAAADEQTIRTYRLSDGAWTAEDNFPAIGNIRELVAPAAREGTLLAWVKDAADLYECRWESGRLTYPKPWPQQADVADRRIVGLEAVGDVVWWARRVGEHLDLYVWEPRQKEPERTRFEQAGAKVERVQWLGGKRLLVQQAYSGAGKLVALDGGKTVVAEPPHLAKTTLAEYRLYADGGRLRVGRLTAGVLQWLDDDLQPTDQVMLPDGQKLVSYVTTEQGAALGLEEGGKFLHELKFDDSGIPRIVRSTKFPGALQLRHDRLLKLMLVDTERVARLSAGRPWELKLVEMIDGREGRISGVKEAVIHRLATTDVDGDGFDEVVLCDDRRHTLSVLERRDDELRPLVSWQVFEDQAYPYGGQTNDAPIHEPRTLLGFDADGDARRDLALLSQNRLLIYLGREGGP